MGTIQSLLGRLLLPDKKVFFTKFFLYLVNLIIIVYLSLIIINSTSLICSRFDARVFLERLQYVPVNPVKAGIFSLLFFLLIVIIEIVRSLCIDNEENQTVQFVLFFIYTALCVGIMYFLNMSNKGILMIPATHAILFVNNKREKIISVVIVFLLYILLDQDLASSTFRLVSLDVFIGYYPADLKIRMIAVKTILFSLNEVLFICFLAVYIQMQITERKHIQELNDQLQSSLLKLQVANVQLEEYAKKSEELAKLKERNRLAREIHDTIGHTLTGIEIGLKACLCLPPESTKEVFEQVGKVYELARKGSKDVRFSLKELRPDALQRYSLLPALESLVKQMNECTKTHSYLLLEDDLPELTATQEELIYRIVQESMTNAVGHGEATEIEIRIGFDGFCVCMSICDNGHGAGSFTEGFGLTNIRERVKYFHGKVIISTAPEKGFTLTVSIPLTRSFMHD
jgi:signal transduction histidine kinase